jgi:outer membrane receptor protein involved in Fe transport
MEKLIYLKTCVYLNIITILKASYIFTGILLILGLTANAQTSPLFDRPVRMDNKPLFLVDNFKTESNYLIIDPNNIESVTVLKDSTSVTKYGQEGKNGVVIVVPKKTARLLQLDKSSINPICLII